MKKNFCALMMAILTVTSLTTVPYSATEIADVVSFSDVPEEHWAYQTIMDMTEAGLFKGTQEPVNGVGVFSPDKQMTRAEFITVALRVIDPEQAAKITQDKEQWWRGYYVLVLDNELLTRFEFDFGDMDKPISREEMAMIMVRCVEKFGEKLTQRVSDTQIADYDSVNEYYKEYVLDCYSYGLLCGVDSQGTFAPARTLTRAEAATVLCRLIDKDMRIDVEYGVESYDKITEDSNNNVRNEDENVPDKSDDVKTEVNNKSETNDKTETNDKSETNIPNKDESGKTESDTKKPLPWDNDGKLPTDYTWEEYQALSEAEQETFCQWFGSSKAFENWMNSVNDTAYEETQTYPWENGGKKPRDYTWGEYEALSKIQQEAFYEWFGSSDAFYEWMNSVKDTVSEDNQTYPWEDGGKKPNDYTWDEFEELSEIEQEAFYEWFGSSGAFDEWMSSVKDTVSDDNQIYPWEDGGKKPNDYTWDEFEELSELEQEAFFEWFDSSDAFEEWMNSVKDTVSEDNQTYPWEDGGKLPTDYTWEEFQALHELEQEAFFEWFVSPDDFEAWMNSVIQ